MVRGTPDRFGFDEGVHLRRVHYQLVSQPDVAKADGSPYQNTEGDWGYLCNAGKYRALSGHGPRGRVLDRRNPDPHVFVAGIPDAGHHEPRAEIYREAIQLARDQGRFGRPAWTFNDPWISGYGYDNRDQAYHLELWIEKCTMDDVLLPLGERLGVNIATSFGFQSITHVLCPCSNASRPAASRRDLLRQRL